MRPQMGCGSETNIILETKINFQKAITFVLVKLDSEF